MAENLSTIVILLVIGYALGITTAFAFLTNSNGNQPTIQIRQEPDGTLGCLVWVLGLLVLAGVLALLSR